jgi:hypothetical protein
MVLLLQHLILSPLLSSLLSVICPTLPPPGDLILLNLKERKRRGRVSNEIMKHR